MQKHCTFAFGVLGALALAACGRSQTANTGAPAVPAATGERIVNADAEPGNWLAHGRNYQETRYSPLDKLTKANVAQLGLAWYADLDTARGQEATPLVIDGVMYTTSAWSKLQAYDAVSGQLLWQYDPKVPLATGVKTCCDSVNRGAAFWNGALFVGALDGRLIAVDAKSGMEKWSVVTVDQSKNYAITGAPRVVKGLVIIGNGGAEYGVRGFVSAYATETGKLVWRFYTVPGEPGKPDGAASDAVLANKAATTWSADSWKLTNGGGGGTVWDSMAYDPDADLLYIGVGNGGPFPQKYRSPQRQANNDNLFLGSILALRPATGEYIWHYQETPGDQWDYTSTQHMILTDLDIGGKHRKVLLHAPKNGFFYVIDRLTGQVISAKPFGKINWASGVDLTTGRPIVNPDADYSRTGKPWLGAPGPGGAHGWQPMAYSPRTRLVYIPAGDSQFPYTIDPDFKRLPVGLGVGINFAGPEMPTDEKILATIRRIASGHLLAWDPVAQKEAWRVSLPGIFNGGVLATAGDLVFQGNMSGEFAAYDATNGTKLWSFDARIPIIASPVSWAKDGVQYVTVMAGLGGAMIGGGPLSFDDRGPRAYFGRVLTFRLGGAAKLPLPRSLEWPKQPPPRQFADAATIDAGYKLYRRSCFGCHGPGAVSTGLVHDLRYSPALANKELWKSIVADGAMASAGMVAFKDNFTPQQIEALRAYVIQRARLTVN